VPNVVPKEDCEAVVETIFDFLEMDPNDPNDWYRQPLRPIGMLEMYQNQALWNARQSPKLHQVFAELLGTHKLWVTIDRANFKPPRHPDHPDYDFKGFIHWDTDTNRRPLVSEWVQGVLCLRDTTEEMGGFHCIPGFHKNLEEWIDQQPADRDPRVPDISRLPEGMKVTPIPAKQGSIVIWNSLLAHGNGHNTGDKPRFSQYIAMYRTPKEGEEVYETREFRVNCWQNRTPPGNSVFPGDPREVEQKRYRTAELTPLGKKLLGLERWEE
jgi:ectoine hydroxylase-related dioxygenase (phytanoyl-CoA dioxygenase family)